MSNNTIRVWATGDSVRVNPQTGKYIEDRTDIHGDYPHGRYKDRNAVWDARAGRVRLYAGRNEFVSFQVVVEAEQPVRDVAVRFDSLRRQGKGKTGAARIAGRNIALFKAWYVQVNQPSTGYDRLSLGPAWYPDALVPAGSTGFQPVSSGNHRLETCATFDIPDEANAIGPTQKNQSVWVDIYVPRERADAPPGEYLGELTVTWPGGRQRLIVELTVWDFALPDENHCHGDIWNDSIRDMPPEQELGYYQIAHQHRFAPGVYGYRPRLTIRGGPSTGSGQGKVKLDWADYDKRLRRYFDGSAFSESAGYWGPGCGVPIDHILMPFNCERGTDPSKAWPMGLPADGPTPAFESAWMDAARQVRAHFDADPTWRAVRRIIFLNGLDESYNEAAYRKMIYYRDLIVRGAGDGWFQYRIDGGYSAKAMAKLAGHVDLWICHTVGFDAAKIARFRARGGEPWFYGPMIYERRANDMCGSNTFLDLDLLTCRGVGWAAWKHKSGYCEWEFDAFIHRDTGLRDPVLNWTQAINFRSKTNAFNGSGLLIYRGNQIGSKDPVPSIRLKAHRRGFQDYEYLWLLAQQGKAGGAKADRLVDSVVRATPFGRASIGNIEVWRNNPEAWDAARIKIGGMLNASA